jgi:medium-chain acyl-[acyl-carrier-protein] hydrolase
MGSRDPDVKIEQVQDWGKETTKSCEIVSFDGDHFFIHPQQRAVIAYIKAVLQRILSG